MNGPLTVGSTGDNEDSGSRNQQPMHMHNKGIYATPQYSRAALHIHTLGLLSDQSVGSCNSWGAHPGADIALVIQEDDQKLADMLRFVQPSSNLSQSILEEALVSNWKRRQAGVASAQQ